MFSGTLNDHIWQGRKSENKIDITFEHRRDVALFMVIHKSVQGNKTHKWKYQFGDWIFTDLYLLCVYAYSWVSASYPVQNSHMYLKCPILAMTPSVCSNHHKKQQMDINTILYKLHYQKVEKFELKLYLPTLGYSCIPPPHMSIPLKPFPPFKFSQVSQWCNEGNLKPRSFLYFPGKRSWSMLLGVSIPL